MTSLRVLLHRMLALFRKQNLEHQLDDEIRAHLDMLIEDYQRHGMSADEARYAALRKFGGVDQVKETYRDHRGLPFIETLFRDLGYGLRMLRRSPGTTLVAVLSLAFGIGVNTALFSAVDAVLLQSLPVKEPDRLIVFEWQSGRPFRVNGLSGTSNVSVPPGHRGFSLFRYDVFTEMDRARLHQPQNPLSDLFAFGPLKEISARFTDHPELIDGQAVSGNYYAGLGIQPSLGRAITSQDDQKGAPPVVVLTNKLWREKFNSNPEVIGRKLTLNKKSFTIVGVDPPSFSGALQVDFQPSVTIALAHEPLLLGSASRQEPSIWWLNVMGRLAPGATSEQARESLNGSFQAAALEVMPPPRKQNQPAQIDVKDYPRLLAEQGDRGMSDVRRDYAPTIYSLFIVVLVVLLIACANLANLLLARGAVRGPEMSVRMALGAGRWRVVRQLLTESLLLSAIGGAVGVIFAFWAKNLLVSLTDRDTGLLPAGVDLHLNWRVLIFTLALSALTGVLFGMVPAWRTTSLELGTALKQSRRTTSVVSLASKLLLVAQVALSSLLLLGAGLFIHTLYNLQTVKYGFNQHNLLLFTLRTGQAGYKDEHLTRLYQQVFERLDQVPGVRSATFGSVELIGNDNSITDFLLPGETESTAAEHDTMRQVVRENYFATMEIPFLRGRQFSAQDGPSAPNVAIVNETFAQQYFPNQDVLGQRISLNPKRPIEIVGVVADTKYQTQREETQPLLYTPWQQEEADDIAQMHFALRTGGEPTALAGAVRQVVSSIDSSLPVTDITTQTARAQATLGQERLYARLLSFFGAVALLLAAIGLFGVLAHSVSQRTKEIGIRMAFGARVSNVLSLIIWQGMKLVLLGLAFAALLGFALKRLVAFNSFTAETWERMKDQLYGVTARDPLVLIAIISLLILVALLACWLPARRAAKVDPLVALRYE